MRLDVRTEQFEFSHGRKPRGRGFWIFAPRGREHDERSWVSRYDLYSKAKATLDPNEVWVVLP